MKTLLLFEIKQTIRHWTTYLTSFVLIAAGTFCGKTFNLTVGEGIFLNSPYTIGFMIGMLSLSILFFAILFSNQILFKVWDTKFDTIFFTLPFSKFEYLSSNFLHLFLKTFICFALLISGFTLGQNLRIGSEIQVYFNLWYYLYPLFIFGFLLPLFTSSFYFIL